jgi:hypothetical protein
MDDYYVVAAKYFLLFFVFYLKKDTESLHLYILKINFHLGSNEKFSIRLKKKRKAINLTLQNRLEEIVFVIFFYLLNGKFFGENLVVFLLC